MRARQFARDEQRIRALSKEQLGAIVQDASDRVVSRKPPAKKRRKP